MAAEVLQQQRRRGLQQAEEEEGVVGVTMATVVMVHPSLSFPLFRWPCFPTAPSPSTRKTPSPGAAVADRATRRVVTVERVMRRLGWWGLLGAAVEAAGGVRAGQEGGRTMNRPGIDSGGPQD